MRAVCWREMNNRLRKTWRGVDPWEFFPWPCIDVTGGSGITNRDVTRREGFVVRPQQGASFSTCTFIPAASYS